MTLHYPWFGYGSGPSGIVVTDLLRKLGLLNETKVVMIDTLHLFPETYDLMERAREFFGLHKNGKIFRCACDFLSALLIVEEQMK